MDPRGVTRDICSTIGDEPQCSVQHVSTSCIEPEFQSLLILTCACLLLLPACGCRAVAPQHRRKGVAILLMNAIEEVSTCLERAGVSLCVDGKRRGGGWSETLQQMLLHTSTHFAVGQPYILLVGCWLHPDSTQHLTAPCVSKACPPSSLLQTLMRSCATWWGSRTSTCTCASRMRLRDSCTARQGLLRPRRTCGWYCCWAWTGGTSCTSASSQVRQGAGLALAGHHLHLCHSCSMDTSPDFAT